MEHILIVYFKFLILCGLGDNGFLNFRNDFELSQKINFIIIAI